MAVALASAAHGAIAAAEPARPALRGDDAHARYLQERAECDRGHPDRDREACLREAAAAYAEARRARPADPKPDYEANSLARCAPLPGRDREDCVARIRGQGSVSGSVEAGGLLREFVTREIRPER